MRRLAVARSAVRVKGTEMDGYKALAEQLWALLHSDIQGMVDKLDPDRKEMWIAEAAEKIREHSKANFEALRKQLRPHDGEEHQKLVDACVRFIEAMQGGAMDALVYLPDWFNEHADSGTDGSEVGSLTRIASAMGYEESVAIERFVEVIKQMYEKRQELGLPLHEMGIAHTTFIARLRDLVDVINRGSGVDESTPGRAALVALTEDGHRFVKEVLDTLGDGFQVKDGKRIHTAFEALIKLSLSQDAVMSLIEEGIGPRWTEKIEASDKGDHYVLGCGDLKDPGEVTFRYDNLRIDWSKMVTEPHGEQPGDREAGILRLRISAPLVLSAQTGASRPKITDHQDRLEKEFRDRYMGGPRDFSIGGESTPIKVAEPSHKPQQQLKDLRVDSVALIDHCPLCGSRDNERPGVHPHNGKICFHSQSTGTNREKLVSIITVAEPCDCKEIPKAHYHMDEHTLVPWDVFEAALEKWKAKQ